MSTGPSHARGPSDIRASYADTIGATPLIRLGRLMAHGGLGAEIVTKLEIANPSGTIADRHALAIVDLMMASGAIGQDGGASLVTVATTRHAHSLALVAAARGLGLILATGDDIPEATLSRLTALGANLAKVDGSAATDLAARADALAAAGDRRVRITPAHERAAAARAGEKLADEIAAQTGGRIGAIVIGADEPGCLAQCAERLRALVPGLIVVGIADGTTEDPNAAAGVLDEIIRVPDEMADAIASLVTQLEALPEARETGRAIAAALTLATRAEMAGTTILTFAGA